MVQYRNVLYSMVWYKKYSTINIVLIRIKDSLQFLEYCLDKLVSNSKDKGQGDDKSLRDTFPTVYFYFKKKCYTKTKTRLMLITLPIFHWPLQLTKVWCNSFHQASQVHILKIRAYFRQINIHLQHHWWTSDNNLGWTIFWKTWGNLYLL